MIDRIKHPIETEFAQYEKLFLETVQTNQYLLDKILQYVRSQKGKQVRPILLLLSAGMVGQISTESIQAAVSLELLHTASLMHDDVVDDTYKRRSGFSVKALWNNKAAILSGDYFLAKSALVSAQMQNSRVSTLLAEMAVELADGELLQMSNESRLVIDEEVYLEVIRKKTAAMFAFCTQVGALSAGASSEDELHLRAYGTYLGMIFQMKDDIFDFRSGSDVGKPTSNDLKEGKMTLPMIFALQKAGKRASAPILNILRNRAYTSINLERINRFVDQYQGIAYTESKMLEYKEKALMELNSFKQSPYKQALVDSVEYFIRRSI